jgi:hypothetical protein
LEALEGRGPVVEQDNIATAVDRQGGVAGVEVGRAPGRVADDPRLDARDEPILPGRTLVAGVEDVVINRVGDPSALARARVDEGTLLEVDGPVGGDVRVKGEEIAP